MSKDKIYVGQKVFLKPVNNAARYGNKDIQEKTIVKIGRKYFFVGREDEAEYFWIKFNIEEHKQVTDYSPDWKLYFSKQQILDEDECNVLLSEFREVFTRWGNIDLTLDQLRRIKAIISE